MNKMLALGGVEFARRFRNSVGLSNWKGAGARLPAWPSPLRTSPLPRHWSGSSGFRPNRRSSFQIVQIPAGASTPRNISASSANPNPFRWSQRKSSPYCCLVRFNLCRFWTLTLGPAADRAALPIRGLYPSVGLTGRLPARSIQSAGPAIRLWSAEAGRRQRARRLVGAFRQSQPRPPSL